MSYWTVYALAALTIWVLMTLVWLVSLKIKNTSIVDIIWGFGFVLVNWVVFEAEVSFISPISTGPGRMLTVHIPVAEKQRKNFSHGQSVDVSFLISEKKNVFQVPQNSILKEDSGEYVFLFKNEKIEKMKVISGITEKGWVTIDVDIPKNSKVVVGNLEALSNGMTVYPVFSEGKKS